AQPLQSDVRGTLPAGRARSFPYIQIRDQNVRSGSAGALEEGCGLACLSVVARSLVRARRVLVGGEHVDGLRARRVEAHRNAQYPHGVDGVRVQRGIELDSVFGSGEAVISDNGDAFSLTLL